jgi:hypothetical protein
MKAPTLFDKVEKVATSLYLCALGSSAKESVMFRNLIDFHVDALDYFATVILTSSLPLPR